MISSNVSQSFLSESRPDDQIDFTDHGAPYISGHSFSLRCGKWFSINNPVLGQHPYVKNDCVYVKTDHLQNFFTSNLVPQHFTLITHNSDFAIDDAGYSKYALDPRVRLWLAMNKIGTCNKIKALPDGIQNAASGGNSKLISAIAEGSESVRTTTEYIKGKPNTFFACYTIASREIERSKCAALHQACGITLLGRMPQALYLAMMSSALFAFCPAGSGSDSCRPWEALALGTIPIVTRNPTYEEHLAMGFPFVILDDWKEDLFDPKKYDEELYKKLWSTFEKIGGANLLTTPNYCAFINQRYGTDL